ncbi:MAG: polysaccharide biosynthesis/export family protein, partial [Candidatus Binatia bacterium]
MASPSYSPTTVGVPGIPTAAIPTGINGVPTFATSRNSSPDLDRLTTLWNKRTQGSEASDYPVGPGDVLDISVPSLEEIKRRTVRVAGDGTISLPLVGTVQAKGLTEEELREEIRRRLEADFMHNPQVDIFVKEYRSRQVAVMGAVAKPGLYSIASGADTILDVISQAGGMTGEA